jgi:uncharacterized repeat protein (TIGR03803 family)
MASPAQTFKTLVAFDGTNGSLPPASLVQGTDGYMYGTTTEGGASGPFGAGTVFRITPAGKLTTLHSFSGTDGAYPFAGLVQGTDGEFYGTTSQGGANGYGAVFKITPTGKLVTVHSFCAQTNCADGEYPFAGLVQGIDGEFYGTTSQGGANGYGTVFKITPEGKLATLYSFCAQADCADGTYSASGLIQAPNGELYGTTAQGGTNGVGTVFKITPKGKLTTLHSFMNTDGGFPSAGLVQAPNGDFYGTTMFRGPHDEGTVFKITAAGVFTTLFDFCSKCGNTSNPSAPLILASDGNFYGTASANVPHGGNHGDGAVFKITPQGELTVLHHFSGGDGAGPDGGLVQDTNGIFYGTTAIKGPKGYGTLFSLSMGLPAFVGTLPTIGKVGTKVTILGTDLVGTTRVSFNGTTAQFKVVSPSEITTIVPTGATTGFVKVTTPKKTLKSNVGFRVTK